MEIINAVVSEADIGTRADAYLAKYCENIIPGSSRNYIKKLIDDGSVTLNGSPVKSNYKVRLNDNIQIEVPDPVSPDVEPEDIPIDIIYEDSDIIIINKARGMVVHPAEGNHSGTLVNALLFHCKDLSDINGVKRPGIVHRIDKDTTGLLVVAKNNEAHNFLAEQIKNHDVSRIYTALVEGTIEESRGTVNAPIGRHPTDRKKMCVNTKNGKAAVTHFTVLKRYPETTLIECRLETGRTHQIRVHLSYIGHPVVGDPVYGRKNNRGMAGQALHAGKLILTHPRTKEEMVFEAPLPQDFQNLLDMVK